MVYLAKKSFLKALFKSVLVYNACKDITYNLKSISLQLCTIFLEPFSLF